jgi:sarcosine oxidase
MSESFDAIVLGLGAMGSAAAYQLAKRGKKILGLDQYAPPHTLGSTHGDTRITRQAIGEGAEYVPLSLRSYEIWREIERLTGRDLLTVTGGLIMASQSSHTPQHGAENFLQTTIDAARRYDIPHEVLDTAEIRKRFPQFQLFGDELGYYEKPAGFLRPERCIEAQLALARHFGASIHTQEQALSYQPGASGDQVTLTTNHGTYTAGQLIVTAGPWISSLLEERYARYFTVYRQVLYWFAVKESLASFLLGAFPIFIWERPHSSIYGFPAIDGSAGGVKIATEDYDSPTSPAVVTREVSSEETQQMYAKHIANGLPGLSAGCVKAVSCLYTVTPDGKFVLDRHPEHPQVIIASPCSGHGFKHSAAIGEVLAQLVSDGASQIDISSFGFSRFQTAQD